MPILTILPVSYYLLQPQVCPVQVPARAVPVHPLDDPGWPGVPGCPQHLGDASSLASGGRAHLEPEVVHLLSPDLAHGDVDVLQHHEAAGRLLATGLGGGGGHLLVRSPLVAGSLAASMSAVGTE